MDALAVKQACKFAKEHALKNGPIVSFALLSSFNMHCNFKSFICNLMRVCFCSN